MWEKTQSQLIQKYFKNNSEIRLTSRTPISAMSVSEKAKLNNGYSLARIVLEDEGGNLGLRVKYVPAECYNTL